MCFDVVKRTENLNLTNMRAEFELIKWTYNIKFGCGQTVRVNLTLCGVVVIIKYGVDISH